MRKPGADHAHGHTSELDVDLIREDAFGIQFVSFQLFSQRNRNHNTILDLVWKASATSYPCYCVA